jgi:hypothetical protein
MDQNKLRKLAGMQTQTTLTESPNNKRYLACSGGDGVDYKVFNTPHDAYHWVEDNSDFQEIIEFTGEILSIVGGSRGEIVLNDGKNAESIYHFEHGAVYHDRDGLSGEVVDE